MKKQLQVKTQVHAGTCRPYEEIVYLNGKPHCMVVA